MNFKHDCKNCEYLGEYFCEKDSTKYDLYFCENSPPEGSVIARFGDDGPDYQSCPKSVARVLEDHPLNVALQRVLKN